MNGMFLFLVCKKYMNGKKKIWIKKFIYFLYNLLLYIWMYKELKVYVLFYVSFVDKFVLRSFVFII